MYCRLENEVVTLDDFIWFCPCLFSGCGCEMNFGRVRKNKVRRISLVVRKIATFTLLSEMG